MWSEKKSLRDFLLIYLSSTIFLLFIGSYFYYQMKKDAIVDNTISSIEKNIDKFILKNQEKHYLKTAKEPDFLNLNIAVYLNNSFKTGSFRDDNLDLNKSYIIKDEKLYFIKKEYKKKWGRVAFISYEEVESKFKKLQFQIIIFLILVLIFIIIIAYILGRILLNPIRKSIEELEGFIRDSTHEINTPISNILINTELLKELYPDFKSIEEFDKIEKSAKRISKIFKDLSFANIRQISKSNFEKIDLKELLEQRVDFFKSFINEKELELNLDIRSCKIVANREDLVRLIDNILSNAIKYSPKKSKIDIILKDKKLIISNSGDIKDTKEVLKKFKRENSSEGGFGLGLYIVQKICAFYDYKLNISSKNKIVLVEIGFN